MINADFYDLDFSIICADDLLIPGESFHLMFSVYNMLVKLSRPDIYFDDERVIFRISASQTFAYVEIPYHDYSIVLHYITNDALISEILDYANSIDFDCHVIQANAVAAKPDEYNLDLAIKGLNKDQKEALRDIIRWSKDRRADLGHILVGYAGTGKSYMLKIVSKLLPGSVVLCAPTNKAVKELKKLNTDLECRTIYSVLGLKMEQFEDTIKLTEESATVPDYDYIVLDECGMTNLALYDHIERTMDNGTKFLFVGDPKQLPPVGEIRSPIWRSFDASVLSIVMRHDNQILELATHVRETKLDDLRLKSNHSRTEGVWVLGKEAFERRLQKYANNGAFEENTKAIAWRNKTVDQMNRIVRYELYGEAVYSSKFFVNDKIVFTSPYAIDEQTSMFTDDEAVVRRIEVAKHRDYDLMCYYLTIQFEKREHIVKVIHESSQATLDGMLNSMANEARQPKCGHIWRQFWGLRTSLCSLKYSYAITAHRSQGSTYDNVFVDTHDILTNPNRNEAKKCLYVAVTRPSQRLFLNASQGNKNGTKIY